MLRTTLAGLRAHMGRLATTVLAIVLGVAFTTGTLVFTDTLERSFATQVMGSMERVDVIAFPPEPDAGTDPEAGPPSFGTAALEEVRGLSEVTAATGVVFGTAPLLDSDGRTLGAFPTAGTSVGGDVARYEAAEGRLPEGDDEVALSTLSAEQGGFTVGDTVSVLDPGGEPHDFTVTGLIEFGLEQSVSYRGAVAFAFGTAERMVEGDGFAEIHVRAAEGVPVERAVTAVAGVLDEAADVRSGQEHGESLASAAGADAAIMGTALLLFAAVSVFVSALVIHNTFAILVAQRQREMALLRCVGALRGQVFRGMLLEALVVGLAASALGTAVGVGLGLGGFALGSEYVVSGTDTPIEPVVEAVPVLAGLLVGTLVTLVSALVPALRATRVAPLDALRSSAVADGLEKGVGRARVAVGAALFLASGAVLALTLSTEAGTTGMALVVASAMVCFVGVLAVSPLLVRGTVRVLGWPLRRLGAVGSLAVDNTLRSPKRAATAMIALTVGATLITGYSVISSSMRVTMDAQLAEQFPVDYSISPQLSPDGEEAPIPDSVAAELESSPLISSVFTSRSASDENQVFVETYPGAELGTDIGNGEVEGDIGDVGAGSAAVGAGTATELGVGLGDRVELESAEGRVSLTVVAIVPGSGGLSGVTTSVTDFESLFPEVGAGYLYVRAQDGTDLKELTEVVDDAVADHPTLQVASAAEIRSEFDRVLETMFLVISGMLGLAILIAVFGISNTMALSVLERRRESALLRALGLSKARLRRMLGAEAVLVSLVGAILGVALGTLFGWAAGRSAFDGMLFALPAVEIAGFLAAAVVAGLLAALMPARRAARTSITGALASE
ncbi:ABC transporter permease [Actinorugispora endophytica]|uniref:Putative ABC transport system permease protein n=1 Tax=Actinorugispora endophytica TaxID=1605990 RepID=A0A4R6UGF6_9ACTN|nr:ABC transporter permease [Actinorugispora endophytica]TDQ45868.1 putative ABC transport system permease protein [Actinorugispora endophytica]